MRVLAPRDDLILAGRFRRSLTWIKDVRENSTTLAMNPVRCRALHRTLPEGTNQMTATTQATNATPLTPDIVAEIVGNIDDIKAAEIIATGANIEEIEEAVTWAAGITRVGKDLGRPLAGVVAEVYAILTSDEEYASEEEHQDGRS